VKQKQKELNLAVNVGNNSLEESKMGKIIVDSINKTSGLASIEIGNHYIVIPMSELPVDITEGSVLKLVIDEEATENRKEHIKKLEDSLFTD
jgi:hypothetical protein